MGPATETFAISPRTIAKQVAEQTGRLDPATPPFRLAKSLASPTDDGAGVRGSDLRIEPEFREMSGLVRPNRGMRWSKDRKTGRYLVNTD